MLATMSVMRSFTVLPSAVDMGLTSFATLSTGDEADLKRVQKLKDAAKNAQRWDENCRRKRALAQTLRL